MKSKLILVSILMLTLASCSSTDGELLAQQQRELEEQRQELEQERLELKQEQNEQEIDNLPDWILSPLTSDDTGFYATGMANSENLNMAMKKAKLHAEFELAKQYKQFLSGSERSYEKENDDGGINSQTEILISKLIDEVPIVGYDVVKQEVTSNNGVITAYILLKMPFDQYNKLIKELKVDTTSIEAEKAFDELELRLKQRKSS